MRGDGGPAVKSRRRLGALPWAAMAVVGVAGLAGAAAVTVAGAGGTAAKTSRTQAGRGPGAGASGGPGSAGPGGGSAPGATGGQAAGARVAALASSPAGCASGAICVTVDGTRPVGPARSVAEGFVHGVNATTSSELLAALHPRSWMYSENEDAYGAARSQGAMATDLLSDAWNDATYTSARGSGIPPWQDWSLYGKWVEAYVRATLANHPVDAWEIQNEPDTPIGGAQPTVAQVLQQFSVAAAAIRAVDPSARIVGPSISAYNDRPGNTIDLATFLDYAVSQHIRLDAVSWHEVGARVSPADNPPDPQSVVIDVVRARRLIAARPQLGHPDIVINEYASMATHQIPGWAVGWIASLEQAGVSSADRSCWHSHGQPDNECGNGSLDGLLYPGSGPAAVYWVHRAYAAMTGSIVAASSPDSMFSAFATRDGAAVRVLVGRHQSCTAAVRPDCREVPTAAPPPSQMEVHLITPWSRVRVSIQRLPNLPGPQTSLPAPSEQVMATDGGSALVAVPSFADGDAYSIVVTAA